MSDLSLFLRELVRRPTEIKAIAPTAPATAREMARRVQPGMRVAEIGAGTGTITEAILARGLAPEDLELYELNAAFCARLRARFPGVTVHHAPAQDMARRGATALDAVISGVPTLSMPVALQRDLVAAALAALKPGAPFVQITYGVVPPLSLSVRAEFGLSHEKSPRIWANLPPAQVYTFRQVRRAGL